MNGKVLRNIMLTYNFEENKGPLYKYLYECIKNDIKSGNLKHNERMPSKRNLAKNLGISIVTVENAYEQLIGEGYLYTLPKKGYYVADTSQMLIASETPKAADHIHMPSSLSEEVYDFSSNQTDPQNFPFSVWAKVMRETLSMQEAGLVRKSPSGGIRELREAIAGHLSSFRGMNVDPDQIIIGAGAEYLYGLLIKLLGKEKRYCLENPGYQKTYQIYQSNEVTCCFADMDDQGISADELLRQQADIAHISPTHHFPTGITMPITRRYELLSWAKESPNRYIVEDDYDSEFRLNGKPIPTLQSIDGEEKVIYINTFSKSLASTIRISYMVLPPHLANKYYENLGFYSCTVSNFEQYALGSFIKQGHFEKHINRTRLYYVRKRQKALEMIGQCFTQQQCSIIEKDSGLHFLLELHTDLTDKEVEKRLLQEKVRLQPLSDFYHVPKQDDTHLFLLNYSGIDMDGLEEALLKVKRLVF